MGYVVCSAAMLQLLDEILKAARRKPSQPSQSELLQDIGKMVIILTNALSIHTVRNIISR